MRASLLNGLILTVAFMAGSGRLPDAASALECTAPADWTERTICDSEELVGLDQQLAAREADLESAADPRMRPALSESAEAWRKALDGCRSATYPQSCMEQRHYGRLDALDHMVNLLVGPRRFGDPLRGCWQRSETDDQAQACLDAKLAEARTGLAVAGSTVRTALSARDAKPGAAGDALSLFEAAETAFAAYSGASCRSEAAALGADRAREHGERACEINAVRRRSVDILRFLPDMAAHWTENIRRAADVIRACVEKLGPADVTGAFREGNLARVRADAVTGGRQDCVVDLADGSVRSVAPVADGDMRPDERIVRYRTGSAPIAQPDCGLAEPVYDGDGAVSGHLIVSGC